MNKNNGGFLLLILVVVSLFAQKVQGSELVKRELKFGNPPKYEITNQILPILKSSTAPIEEFEATITGYNTIKSQTDSTPCISASGANICGRTDVIACPRKYPLGSVFEIKGKEYICEDRLALKYDHRIDINCNLDFKCSSVTSREIVKVISLGK